MWAEVRTTVIASIGFMFFGITLAWSSIVGPQIVQNESFKFWISKNNFGFVVGAMSLGAVCSCVLSGIVRHKIGTKKTIFIFSMFAAVGAIFLTIPINLYLLILGRFLTGISIGCYSFLVPIYVGEIASNENRGLMLGLLHILLSFGILFVYIIGYFFTLQTFNILCGSVPLFYAIAFYGLPETPVHLLSKEKIERTHQSLMVLRGDAYDEKEVTAMQNGLNSKRKSFIELVKTKSVRKALIIIMFQFFAFQLAGGNAVVFYSVQIYHDAQIKMDPIIASLINAFQQLIIAFVAAFYIKKYGRKRLLCTFNVLLIFSLIALGFYFGMKENGSSFIQDLSWLPLLALCIYMIAFGLGMAPITYTWLGELFTLDGKKAIAPLGQVVNHTLTFLIGLSFPYLSSVLGTGTMFFIFAVVTMADIIFVILFVPETIGRSVDEIQHALSK